MRRFSPAHSAPTPLPATCSALQAVVLDTVAGREAQVTQPSNRMTRHPAPGMGQASHSALVCQVPWAVLLLSLFVLLLSQAYAWLLFARERPPQGTPATVTPIAAAATEPGKAPSRPWDSPHRLQDAGLPSNTVMVSSEARGGSKISCYHG